MLSPPRRHRLRRVKLLMDYVQPHFVKAYQAMLTGP